MTGHRARREGEEGKRSENTEDGSTRLKRDTSGVNKDVPRNENSEDDKLWEQTTSWKEVMQG